MLPHLRIMRVYEDADEDGELLVPDVEDVDDEGEPVVAHPWHCDCGQTNNASWTDCAWCGMDREEF